MLPAVGFDDEQVLGAVGRKTRHLADFATRLIKHSEAQNFVEKNSLSGTGDKRLRGDENFGAFHFLGGIAILDPFNNHDQTIFVGPRRNKFAPLHYRALSPWLEVDLLKPIEPFRGF